MAKKISNKDFFEPDFGKPLIEVFKDIQKEIEESIKGVRKFGSALKDEVKANKLETAEDVQKLSEARKKANKAIETESELQKQRVKILEQLKQAQTEEYKENERLRAELNRQKKEVRETFKEEEKLNRERKAAKGSIVQMRLELSRLTKAYDNLSKEERENAQVGGVLLKQIQKQRQAVGDLERATGRAQRNVGNYAEAWGRVGSLFSRGLGFLGITAGLAGIKSFIDSSIEAFREQEKAVAQVKAGIEATGGAAGLSLRQLKEEATALQRETLFGDEEILKNATAQLLTFTNITGENFKRTQAAALDLATRLDGDLKSASIQLGKALNDPVANLSALSRSGIQFSKEQKEVIKDLTETGRLAEAQTIILDELNKQYGGSAVAAANADAGFTQLANSFGDVKEIVGQVIVEGLRPLIRQLKEFFDTIDERDVRSFFDALKTGFKVITVGVSAWIAYKAAIKSTQLATTIYTTVTKGAQIATALFSKGIKGAAVSFKGLNTVMKANPIGLVVSAITAAITALSLFNDEVDETIEKQDELEKRTGASLENRFQARRRYSISQLQALRDDLEENKRINEEELSDFTATANAENEIIQNRIDFNKKEIEELRKGLAERIKNFGGNKKLIDLEKKDTQESIDLLEEKIKADEAELKVVKDSNPVIDKRIEQIKEINELLRQRRKESKQAGEKAPSVLPGVDLAEEQAENTKKFNDEILKGTEDTIEKTVEAVKDGADQVADIEDDKLDKQRERNRKMLEIAQEFYSEQGRARREQIDREIADSKRREDQLTQLAAGGSEEAQRSLALEQQRQSQLEQERRKSLSRQRQLAFGLAGSELIISNARQGSSDPAGKSLEQLSAFASGVSDIFKNLPAFETGGKVKGGEQIVRINEKGEEFVVKHSAVEKYGDKMLNDINNGTFDAFNYVQTPSGIVHQNFTTDFSNLERKVETLISEVKNKPVPYIAISEVTGGLKKTIQEGNKFTTQHFRKSNLF
jgi:myosin heavy subunit